MDDGVTLERCAFPLKFDGGFFGGRPRDLFIGMGGSTVSGSGSPGASSSLPSASSSSSSASSSSSFAAGFGFSSFSFLGGIGVGTAVYPGVLYAGFVFVMKLLSAFLIRSASSYISEPFSLYSFAFAIILLQ